MPWPNSHSLKHCYETIFRVVHFQRSTSVPVQSQLYAAVLGTVPPSSLSTTLPFHACASPPLPPAKALLPVRATPLSHVPVPRAVSTVHGLLHLYAQFCLCSRPYTLRAVHSATPLSLRIYAPTLRRVPLQLLPSHVPALDVR